MLTPATQQRQPWPIPHSDPQTDPLTGPESPYCGSGIGSALPGNPTPRLQRRISSGRAHLSRLARPGGLRSCWCVPVKTPLTMVTYMVPYKLIDVREYIDRQGRSAYADWFNRLNAQAAAKVTTALTRLAGGNFSNVKGVGSGAFECRIDFGPGYRVYFGKDGERLIILLGGERRKGSSRTLTAP